MYISSLVYIYIGYDGYVISLLCTYIINVLCINYAYIISNMNGYDIRLCD